MTTRISPEHDTRELTTDDVLGSGPPQILTHARRPDGDRAVHRGLPRSTARPATTSA